MKHKPDWFLSGMGAAIFLAWIFPGPGGAGGWLQAIDINKTGVAVVFFLHGVALSFSALRGGLARWRAHAAIQLTTFLAFPLAGLGFLAVTRGHVEPALATGFFFLCALPSTVSSSVAMTAAARGNVPVAVFNAALSSLLGIFLTPLWMALTTGAAGFHVPLGPTIENLCLWLFLPLLAGLLLHPFLGGFVHRHKQYIGKIDRVVILLLVYTSFCGSFAAHIWTQTGGGAMAVMGATVLLLFAVIGTTWAASAALRAPRALRSAVVFCASKKSLAAGVPMAQLMFAGNPALGLILLPIMIYHPLQLFVCGPLASRWAKESAAN